jgi:hypothetical protein
MSPIFDIPAHCVAGVISVAIDSKASANSGAANSVRATIRTRLSHEKLLQHIAAIGGYRASLETEIKDGAAVRGGDSDSPRCERRCAVRAAAADAAAVGT